MKRDRDEKLARHMERVARLLRARAWTGEFDGRVSAHAMGYLDYCRVIDRPTGAVLIFTRDSGHHSSGWLKNPDYERCFHLSTSPVPTRIIIPGAIAELDKKTARRWVEAFFKGDVGKVWSESPKTTGGRTRNVWHWRLFCDEQWKPILPRGEVYSKEFTEIGWRSASQVLEEDGRIITSPVDPS